MKQRTRLILLAGSVIALAGASRGEAAAASTCSDSCYSQFQYCMWTTPGPESEYCYWRLDRCLASCGTN